MSREVEVTGIKMTASVPEGLEISLGKGMITGSKLESGTNANNATKIVAPANPSGTTTEAKLDWTNSVAVSDYYDFGYLLPASSNIGTDLFYTMDANEAGRSVAVNAKFLQADSGTTPAMTSYNLITSKAHASEYAEKNKKGYYIDIPVWFRTSNTNNVTLGVVANVTTGRLDSGTTVDGTGDLYKAARVAILGANSAVNTGSGANKIMGGIDVVGSEGKSGTYYDRYAINSKNQLAVKATGSLNGKLAAGTSGATAIGNASSLYDSVQWLKQATLTNNKWNGDAVITVTGSSNNNYGASVEKTIRVWLEGEDTNCWNPNAGQSFTIDLKFVRLGDVAEVTAANKTS